jgi:hypothetical protein
LLQQSGKDVFQQMQQVSQFGVFGNAPSLARGAHNTLQPAAHAHLIHLSYSTTADICTGALPKFQGQQPMHGTEPRGILRESLNRISFQL